MTEQSLLRLVKRWRSYEPRGDWESVPPKTRGFYVLYRKGRNAEKHYEVVYIGVAGLGKKIRRGIGGRLRTHDRGTKKWSHYSFYEVHDNVTREDIRELESLLLGIFKHDPRIRLENVQRGSRALYKLRRSKFWPENKRPKK